MSSPTSTRSLLGRGARRRSRTRDAARLCQLPRLRTAKRLAGFASYGYAKSQHRFVWGVRLVLVSDPRGVPLGYTLVPANEKEYEPLAHLLTGTPGEVVIADKGL
jgi:Transposase DDE domain